MKTITKVFAIIFGIAILIELLKILFIPLMIIGMATGGYFLYKRLKKDINMRTQAELEESKEIEWKESIDFKMGQLLEMANFDMNNTVKRTAYKSKPQLDLLDQWYKYIDLRAKLHLNNTSTSREESVLHLMCDEMLNRLQLAEVEITDVVRTEFIVENLSPLLHDILEIMEGIRPTDSISIDAYQLLNKSKGQEESMLEQLSR
jgi:hypothetical protein